MNLYYGNAIIELRNHEGKVTDMKKNALPVLVIGGLIAVILIYLGISAVIEKYTPTDERQNLTEYYNIKEETQVAIILDNQILDAYGTLIDGQVYLDYKLVDEYLNNRFYWDANEKLLLYTTTSSIITIPAESTSYRVDDSTEDFGKVIAKTTKDSVLIHIDFVQKYSNISCNYYESPNRLAITSAWGEITVVEAQEDTQVRFEGHIKSPILADVTTGSLLTILEIGETWHKVATADGLIGYTECKRYNSPTTQNLVSEYPEEVFNHLTSDKPINLLWHQIFYAGGNSTVKNVLSQSKSVTVMSPTWFRIKDNEGNLQSIASNDYVSYCHKQGVEVWGLVTNVDIKVDITHILTHTSVRQNLINQLISKAVEYKLDGINVDIESLYDDNIGDGYIQFLRELSVACEKNNLILSTAVPPVTGSNYLYGYEDQPDYVDYVVVMAYDEHYGVKSGAGSIASLNWTENAIVNLMNSNIPSNQLVLGIPFYSGFWIFTPNSSSGDYEVTYELALQKIRMETAQKWLKENETTKQWLEDCGQYYYESKKDGILYKLWLEDATSLEKRLQLMQKYELAGAAYWKSGMETSDVWDVISKYFK